MQQHQQQGQPMGQLQQQHQQPMGQRRLLRQLEMQPHRRQQRHPAQRLHHLWQRRPLKQLRPPPPKWVPLCPHFCPLMRSMPPLSLCRPFPPYQTLLPVECSRPSEGNDRHQPLLLPRQQLPPQRQRRLCLERLPPPPLLVPRPQLLLSV